MIVWIRSRNKCSRGGGGVEVICVNDGSTDGSEKIIDEYSEKYDYFKKINQPNSGVSCARNTGIEASTGDYITFVDSDDYVAENAYLPILDICYKENLDAFLWRYTRPKGSGGEFAKWAAPQLTDFNIQEDIKYSIINSFHDGLVVLCMFKAELIRAHNIRFDPMILLCEDNVFCLEFNQYANRIARSELCVYFYRVNENSLTNKESTVVEQISHVRAYKMILKFKKTCDLYEFSEYVLSTLLCGFLLRQMRNKVRVRETAELMEKYEIAFSDITALYDKSNSENLSRSKKIKKRLLCLFRYPFIYKVACLLYRIAC